MGRQRVWRVRPEESQDPWPGAAPHQGWQGCQGSTPGVAGVHTWGGRVTKVSSYKSLHFFFMSRSQIMDTGEKMHQNSSKHT